MSTSKLKKRVDASNHSDSPLGNLLESFVSYGTALPSLADTKKDAGEFVPVWEQQVTDEQGRRRFHGAFTGGFSAGYYNSVGSKEGSSVLSLQRCIPIAYMADCETTNRMGAFDLYIVENDSSCERGCVGDSRARQGLYGRRGESPCSYYRTLQSFVVLTRDRTGSRRFQLGSNATNVVDLRRTSLQYLL